MSFFIERSSHPSRDQILVLLEFLEKNPSIAKGFPKLPSARVAARKQWEKLAARLNSISGSLKSWKQWTKYWADKKSAVKKKASVLAAARRRGETELTIELSEIEERILTLIIGVCATGDRHLKVQKFEDNTDINGGEDDTGPGYVKVQSSDEPSQKKETMDPLDVSTSSEDNNCCVAGTSYVSNSLNYVPVPLPTPDREANSPSLAHIQNEMLSEPTSIKKERSPLRHTVPRRLRPRRRVLRVTSPPPAPSWQMQFESLTDRSLRMEEQRLELDRRHTDILETVSGLMGQLIKRDIERERLIAQAVSSVGEGLKLLANALNK